MSVIKNQHILLPRKQFEMSKWSVIAYDQFTKDKEYWESVQSYTSGAPTTLDLILPNIYFAQDNSERVAQIIKNMRAYNDNNIFEDLGQCMVLVDRSTPEHKKRLGLMLCVDLENYEPDAVSNALIRPSECPFINRIPARVELRQNTIFELPHIILLYDDREQNIAETLYKEKENLEKLYDFNLNMGGGHITGYKIKNAEQVIAKFNELISATYTQKIYGTEAPPENPLMFIIGEGNSSLRTAKEHWNKLKPTLDAEQQESHPARFALVEAINLHDEGVDLVPIHRIIKNANRKFIKKLRTLYKLAPKELGTITTKVYLGEREEEIKLPNNTCLAVKLVQDLIDKFLSKDLEMSIDYTSKPDEVTDVCAKDDAIGIILPQISKTELFEFIMKFGALPRRTFNFGTPKEKRYYLEVHKIKLI